MHPSSCGLLLLVNLPKTIITIPPEPSGEFGPITSFGFATFNLSSFFSGRLNEVFACHCDMS